MTSRLKMTAGADPLSIGYIAAVTGATFPILLLFAAVNLCGAAPDWASIRFSFATVLIFWLFAFFSGLVPFVIIHQVAARLRLHGLIYYGCCGAVAGGLWGALCDLGIENAYGLCASSFAVCGVSGGLAYWLAAGRRMCC